MTRKCIILIAVIVICIAGTVVLATIGGSPTKPAPVTTTVTHRPVVISTTTPVSACLPAPKLHSYETYTTAPDACVIVPSNGVTLKNLIDVTIDGGTWRDSIMTKPIINVIGGAGITLENMKIVGSNVNGSRGGPFGNNGLQIDGTFLITVTNVSVRNVYGSCLAVESLRTPSKVIPTEGLIIDGFTGSGCGTNGISPISIDGSDFSHMTIGNPLP